MSRALVFDFGDVHLTAAIANLDGPPKVESVATVPVRALRRGVVSDPTAAVTAIQTATGELGGVPEGAPVFAGLSGVHVEALPTQGLKLVLPKNRALTHQDVLEVVNHSRSVVLPGDREQIHVVPRQFRVDGKPGVLDPVGQPASRLEVDSLVVSAHSESVRLLERAFGAAGIPLDRLVFGPLASGLGVLTTDEVLRGAVCVDLGAGVTDVALFLDGSLAAGASLPVGGALVTQDVATLLKTSVEDAERLKLEHGSASPGEVTDKESVEVQQLGQPAARPMQRRVLVEIIESRVREIARLARQAAERGRPGSISGVPVILTGGGARLKGTERVFASVFGDNPVRTVEPSRAPAAVIGLARYAQQCQEDPGTAAAPSGWRDRVRNLLSW